MVTHVPNYIYITRQNLEKEEFERGRLMKKESAVNQNSPCSVGKIEKNRHNKI